MQLLRARGTCYEMHVQDRNRVSQRKVPRVTKAARPTQTEQAYLFGAPIAQEVRYVQRVRVLEQKTTVRQSLRNNRIRDLIAAVVLGGVVRVDLGLAGGFVHDVLLRHQ